MLDREKKKYFKILPNHVALRGTQYTKENVERIKENEKVGSLLFIVSIFTVPVLP